MITHLVGLLANPKKEWRYLRSHSNQSTIEIVIATWLIIATLPPLSLLIGLTGYGWQNFDGSLLHLSAEKAVPLAIVLYLLLLSIVLCLAYLMYRLENFAGGQADFERCLVFAIFTSLPLFISGLGGLIPSVWFSITWVVLAGMYSARLLFTGMPIFLDVAIEHRPLLVLIILLISFALLALCGLITFSLWMFA